MKLFEKEYLPIPENVKRIPVWGIPEDPHHYKPMGKIHLHHGQRICMEQTNGSSGWYEGYVQGTMKRDDGYPGDWYIISTEK
jgi:hypothetical protein